MMTHSTAHIPVLYEEVLTQSDVKPDDLWVDCTLGRGGHTLGLLQRGARVIGLDRDRQAIAESSHTLQSYLKDDRLSIIHTNFSDITQTLKAKGIERVDGILADLGVSSPQLDEAERGFSFMKSGPLDMRMDRSHGLSAAEWVQEHSTKELAHIFRLYGEEPRALHLAKVIKAWSDQGGGDTLDLSRLVETSTPMRLRRKLKKHPATRVFQALRIAVNDELGALESLLELGPSLLTLHGKMLLISFHSLEDRLIKKRFRVLSEPPPSPRRGLPPPPHEPPAFTALPRKGLIAEESERLGNPRSRSARLRILTRIRNPHEKV